MTVRIYDSSDLAAEPVVVRLKSSPSGIAWHPTGVEFTTTEVSGIVTFWSAPDGTQKPSKGQQLKLKKAASFGAYSPDGTKYVVTSYDHDFAYLIDIPFTTP